MKPTPIEVRSSRPKIVVALLATLAIAMFAVLPNGLASAAPAAVAKAKTAKAVKAKAKAKAKTAKVSSNGIWPESTVPDEPFKADEGSVTLGLEFSSDSAGQISGVQYYAAGANRVSTTGNVWNSSGRRVASVSFPQTSTNGWKTALLSSPVKIQADERYTVSYRAPNGGYAFEENVFSGSKSKSANGLTAYRGTYVHGSGRPTNTWHGAHYFVDVVFKPTGSTSTPPTTTPTTPAPATAPAPAPATATATSDLRGWDLTATNIGLAPHGLACDTLPVYSGPAKPARGAVISGVRVTVPLNLSAGGITVEKSCLKPTSLVDSHVTVAWGPTAEVIIRDSEIDGSAMSDSTVAEACGIIGAATLLRNYVHDVGSGICFMSSGSTVSSLVQNNYVHKLRHAGNAHHEAATVRDFVKNSDDTRTLKFVDNRLNSDSDMTSGGLFIQPTWEDIHNLTIEGNLIEGNGYNIWAERTANATYSNIRAINNRFGGGANYYGPVATSGPGWAEWRDNSKIDLSKPDARGAVVTP